MFSKVSSASRCRLTARSKAVLPIVAADVRRRNPLNVGALTPPRCLGGYVLNGPRKVAVCPGVEMLNVQNSTPNIQHPTPNIQSPTPNPQPSTFNLQLPHKGAQP